MRQKKEKIALILNSNAGRVTREVKSALLPLNSPRVRVFLSDNEQEGEEYVREICQGNFGLIISGGGDDTSRSILDGLEKHGNGYRPCLAAVKLGTGNGTAHYVGAGNPLEDIARLCAAEVAALPLRTIPLITISAVRSKGLLLERTHFNFAGTGLDAMMLQHYETSEIKGLWGYLAAIPKTLRQLQEEGIPYSQVRATGLTRLERHNGEIRAEAVPPEIEKGLFSNSVTVGTTPYFGFGFMALPWAEEAAKKRQMHLRLVQGTPAAAAGKLVNNIIPLWRGTFQGKPLEDYCAEEVTVTFPDQPGYLQVAGKSKGAVSSVTYRIDGAMQWVDFRKMNGYS